MNVSDYWINFTRTRDFPREVCAKDMHTELAARRTAINSSQFVDFLKSNNGKKHCFMGLFSRMQRVCKIYDTVFFDIDAPTLDEASKKAHTVLDAMKAAFRDASPRIYFSGKKGYHIYYDIEPTYLQSYKGSVYAIVMQLKLKDCIDCQVISDNILCRLPYTMHMSTKLMCIPILARHVGYTKRLMAMAINPEIHDIVNRRTSAKLANALRSYNKDEEEKDAAKQARVADVSEDPVPLCVSSSYNRLINGTAEHPHRIFLAMYMINSGAGVDCAMSAFKSAPDFVMKQTRYQVNYTDRKKLKVYGCRTLIRNDVCPLDADTRCLCSWFPNIYRQLTVQNKSAET